MNIRMLMNDNNNIDDNNINDNIIYRVVLTCILHI